MFNVFKRLFRPRKIGNTFVYICIRQHWNGDKNIYPLDLIEFLDVKVGDKFKGYKIVAIKNAAFGRPSYKTLVLGM